MSRISIKCIIAIMKIAMTIAGSDPTGGAGLQADLRVFKSLGVHGLSAPSSLTVQSTRGVEDAVAVEERFFIRQLDVLLGDIRPDALKTGMLYAGYIIEAVSSAVSRYSLKNLVVDPVTVSSTGTSLLEEGSLELLKARLFPLARVITPNIYEASVFTGISVEDVAGMQKAAKALREMGSEVVIITGGHLDHEAIDLYYDGGEFHSIVADKVEGEYHGTGCAFSAAIAAFLALGETPFSAAQKAKAYVEGAIKRAFHPGKGMGMLYL